MAVSRNRGKGFVLAPPVRRRGRWSRRGFLHAVFASSAWGLGGCLPRAGQRLPPEGQIIGASRERGHRLRIGQSPVIPEAGWTDVSVVIVGGGVAGLASLRELQRQGQSGVVLLELEDAVGGTARGGNDGVVPYPWGAHYLPAPLQGNRPLIELLEEMNLVRGYDEFGDPLFQEEHLCRDPAERLFAEGAWQADLLPAEMTTDEQTEWTRFQQLLAEWIEFRDEQGRRAFSLPARLCSPDPRVLALDAISAHEWLEQHHLRSNLVRWEVDYACRDDYGTSLQETSAWAALFYFVSRMRSAAEPARPLLTWPEGNARLVQHLASGTESLCHTGQTVISITPDQPPKSGLVVVSHDARTDRFRGWRAQRVIFAAPQFVARHVIRGWPAERSAAAASWTYAPWLVANLHLTGRPRETTFPAAWDNVLRDSPGLGYVIATHQTGRDHGPTVFTYYRPWSERAPREAREWLEQLTWKEAAELVLSDLEVAHPDLRSLVSRLDVCIWGHGMVRPIPGFRTQGATAVCSQPWQGVHFAHTDLSGLALFEEAYDHGWRAAREVLAEGHVSPQGVSTATG